MKCRMSNVECRMSEAFHTPHGSTVFDPEAQTRRELAQVLTPHTRSSRGGFSLVELLVVIAIIIILVGLALAGINIANQRAEEGEVRTILGSLAGVEKEYRAQTGQQVGTASNGDLSIYDPNDPLVVDADSFLYILQSNSQVAAEMLLRLPEKAREMDTIGTPGVRVVAKVKDPWGTAIRYHDGSGDNGNAVRQGMPQATYPFFASAGPDGLFGRWDNTGSNNKPATSGTDWDADSNNVPDAQDNLYSFEVK